MLPCTTLIRFVCQTPRPFIVFTRKVLDFDVLQLYHLFPILSSINSAHVNPHKIDFLAVANNGASNEAPDATCRTEPVVEPIFAKRIVLERALALSWRQYFERTLFRHGKQGPAFLAYCAIAFCKDGTIWTWRSEVETN